MFRLLLFCAIIATIIYFFGSRMKKWLDSFAEAADRKEMEKWKQFDKKLNPNKKK